MTGLTLIRGIPGTGKSTLAQTINASVGGMAKCFEADMFFMQDGEYKFDRTQLYKAHHWCRDSTKEALADGRYVIVSNTFTTIKELKPYFELATIFDIVPTVLITQTEWGNIHGVPPDVLDAMRERFQYDISSLYAKA